MKYCPQCQSQFDDSISFCLNDGTLLIGYNDDQPTFVSQSRQTQRNVQESSPQNFTKYLLIALLGVVALAGLLAAIWWKSNEQNPILASANSQTTADNLKLKEKELELQEKELELKKRELESNKNAVPQNQTTVPQNQTVPKPLPPSNPNSSSNYSGSIGNASSTFNLSWNKNNTVTGSFYYNGSPNAVYILSGSNFRKGEAEINVYNGSQVIATMKINKKIGGNKICWSGSFYQTNGGTHPVSLCRYR